MSNRRRAVPRPVATRGQAARWQRERRLQHIIIAIAIFAVVVIGATIGSGYYITSVRPLHQVAVSVNDTSFSTAYFIKMLRYYGIGDAAATNPTLGRQAVDVIASAQLVRDRAAGFGLEATSAEVDQEVRTQLGVLAVPPEDPTEREQQEALFRERQQQLLEASGLSPEEFRDMAETAVLRRKLTDYVAENIEPVPTSAPQVHLFGLQIKPEDLETVQARLAEGADPKELSIEYSQHIDPEHKEGDLGWLPRGILDTRLEEVAFSLEPGGLSDPVEVSGSHWFLEVLEKEDDREIEEQHRDILKVKAFSQWMEQEMNALKANGGITDYLTDERIRWAANRASD